MCLNPGVIDNLAKILLVLLNRNMLFSGRMRKYRIVRSQEDGLEFSHQFRESIM